MASPQELNFLYNLFPLIGTLFVIAGGVILLNQHFRKNLYKQKLEQEEIRNQHQLQLLKSTIDAQEVERQRIAKDLHDELGAMLSMARMQIKQMQKQDYFAAKNSLDNLQEIIETSLASTRRICYQLMPPQLERYGLASALESLEEQVNATQKTQASITFKANFPRFSNAIELGLYRVISELVNNTLKHAEATQLSAEFEITDNLLTCRYHDNGVGISIDSEGKGLGMNSMDARIGALGGNFELVKAENGFSCFIKIPF